MATGARAREAYRVGDLSIDVGQQRVTGPVGEIALPRLSFELLLALVRRAPDFVTNDELSATVWAGLVVTPETVTKRVNLLREALGDEASNPRYVAGLRARGYRIAVPVERIATETADAVAAAIDAPAVAVANAAVAPTPSGHPRWLLPAILVSAIASGILWWFADERPAELSTTVAVPRSAADRTVAVLRFRNLSPDPRDSYLAAGVPEMILDRLAKIAGLTVIASGSALAIESEAMPSGEAGAKLGARYLVEGSAQRDGETLRVTARLVDARTSTQVWSTRTDRKLDDLFVLQDEIAAQVAVELGNRIKGVAPLPPAAPNTPSIEAQLAFLQGRSLLARGTVKDSVSAIQRFTRATEFDPGFAAAYAGLYDAYMLAAERRHERLDAERQRHESLIQRALDLDPNCGSAYVARAIWSDSDDARRDADFRRGLELDPSNGRGLIAYSSFLARGDRSGDARRMLERALLVDPTSPRVYFALVQSRFKTDGGLSLEDGMRRVLEIDPDYQPALQRYAKYRWMHHGKLAEAAQIIEHAIEVDPENPWSRHTAAAIYLDLDDVASARRVAAGTASSAATSQILLALHEGDWRAAGEAALTEPGRRYNRYESWGAPEAARDFALKTGDTARVIRWFEERYGLQEGAKFDLANFRAAVCLAQLLRQSGNAERARRLLDALPPAIEATISTDGPVYALRTLASIRLLAGDQQGALDLLTRSFRAEDLMQWWYTIERDPLWEPLRSTPRFQAIERDVRVRVAQERAILVEWRRAGQRPRPADASTAKASAVDASTVDAAPR
jgi:TolB-like protein/DNA-binding winged helix-turn-helix (wHTH) protein/Tfp pilus assembly protein PilF